MSFSYAPTQTIAKPTAPQVTRPTSPTRVTRETAVKPTYRIGQRVDYTSRRGITKTYRIEKFARNGRIQLSMIGRYPSDRMAGKRFWADRCNIAA